MWQSQESLERDFEIIKGHHINYKPYLNFLAGTRLIFFFYRLRKRLAGELQKRFNISSKWAISYSPRLMFKSALKENADLYAAHLECAFYAGKKLVNAGKRVSFDFEDWYSRDYLVPERPVRLLESLENFALNKGVFCTTTSKALAKSLMAANKINKGMTVIYNGFSRDDLMGGHEASPVTNSNTYTKIIWFSRTIGPGRGIEFFLDALKYCDATVELHLLGEAETGYEELINERFSLLKPHLLVIHPFMPHDHLLSFISQFQIGLAIEENINDNKSLTISNKILQYLQGGLPVIASDTAGQREVAAYFPEKVKVVDIHDPAQVADAILQLKEVTPGLSHEEQRRFEEIFSWEAQEKKLDELVGKYYEG